MIFLQAQTSIITVGTPRLLVVLTCPQILKCSTTPYYNKKSTLNIFQNFYTIEAITEVEDKVEDISDHEDHHIVAQDRVREETARRNHTADEVDLVRGNHVADRGQRVLIRVVRRRDEEEAAVVEVQTEADGHEFIFFVEHYLQDIRFCFWI